MKAAAFWLYQIYAWLVFFPLVIILTLLFSALTIIFATLVNPEWASRVFAATWGKLLALLTPVHVTVEGSEHAHQGQSYVVAINHQSQYDILVVYGWLKLDLKWVIKQELRKVPGIGLGCEKAGHIFIDRQKPEAGVQGHQGGPGATWERRWHPVLSRGNPEPGRAPAAIQKRRFPIGDRPGHSRSAGHLGGHP